MHLNLSTQGSFLPFTRIELWSPWLGIKPTTMCSAAQRRGYGSARKQTYWAREDYKQWSYCPSKAAFEGTCEQGNADLPPFFHTSSTLVSARCFHLLCARGSPKRHPIFGGLWIQIMFTGAGMLLNIFPKFLDLNIHRRLNNYAN